MRGRVLGLVATILALVVSQGCDWLVPPNPSAGYRITDAIPYEPIGQQGDVFFTKTVTVSFYGTSALLCLNGYGAGEIMVDDVMYLDIRWPNGSLIRREIDFTDGCSHPVLPLSPREIGHWLKIGENTITFTFQDQCGGNGGSTEIWLVIQ